MLEFFLYRIQALTCLRHTMAQIPTPLDYALGTGYHAAQSEGSQPG
jgi:hypothetical protein